MPPPEGPPDLDALIGDLRLEAARSRADPAYPVEEEVRLGAALDGQAAQTPKPRLEALADAIDRLLDTGASRHSGRLARFKADGQPELISLTAAALRAASSRIADLEARVRVLEARPGPDPITALEPPSGLEVWFERIRATAPATGRHLYWGAGAEAAVDRLRAEGFDAYGITPEGDEYRAGPDVRHGGLLEHLRSVGDDSLTSVVAGGAALAPDPGALAVLSTELARVVTAAAVVVSEAPWSWARRVGATAADLASARPLMAETWIPALRAAGMNATAEYAPDGASYLVVARPRA